MQYFCTLDTIKLVLAVPCIQQPPALIGLYFEIPDVHFNSKFACVKQPYALKGHFFSVP